MQEFKSQELFHELRIFGLVADHDIALDEGALLISAVAYPNIDLEFWRHEIDSLSELAAARVAKEPDQISGLCALLEFLYGLWGLKGNREDFYDVRNSYLHEVLERRKGISISMATLLMEIGRRSGLELQGVAFPAHFLVKPQITDELFVDPFAGRLIDVEGCRKLLNKVSGGNIAFSPSLLAPADNRSVLVRTLTNLKGIYIQKSDLKTAIRITEAILMLVPEAYHEIRDRGILHLYGGAYRRALRDFELYAELNPPDLDFLHLENLLNQARRGMLKLN